MSAEVRHLSGRGGLRPLLLRQWRGPGAPQAGTNGLPKHSYWLDLWLFVLLDVVLFLFVYLLP
uniref:HCV F-transactivated protein 1 n=1 Tax=Spermophilus dauricus TaxID=99837 RepID=A0A8C9UJF5_SPEDA